MKNETVKTTTSTETTTEQTKFNKLSAVGATPARVYNVEKVKLNKLPRHFNDEDRENKMMSIDGRQIKVMINRDRTQYVAFSIVRPTKDNPNFVQHYYVRDHRFFSEDDVVTYIKPKAEVTTDQPADNKETN